MLIEDALFFLIVEGLAGDLERVSSNLGWLLVLIEDGFGFFLELPRRD